MKKTKVIFVVCLMLTAFLSDFRLVSQDLSPTEIVKKAKEKMDGLSNESEMTMTIVRPTWKRTYSFRSWMKGSEYSLTLILEPTKEKGRTFLKRENEMWSWNPRISRMIKLPPSTLSQGWMGSDFTNDDLLKESSIVKDYNHYLIGSEDVEGVECFKIKLEPKEDAPVIWGKQIKWISKDELLQLKTEYYDEDGFLIKTELAYNIKEMDGRLIPTKFELIPEEEEGNKTIMEITKIDFDIDKSDDFFSQQNMKRVR